MRARVLCVGHEGSTVLAGSRPSGACPDAGDVMWHRRHVMASDDLWPHGVDPRERFHLLRVKRFTPDPSGMGHLERGA